MKVAIIGGDPDSKIGVTLMQWGHSPVWFMGGAFHAAGAKHLLECDAFLLIDDKEEFREYAEAVEASGRKVCRTLAEFAALL